MLELTDKQKEVLEFIRRFRESHGYSPSSREIQDKFGYLSQTSAMNHVKALVRKGALRKVDGASRTLVPV